ncbi:MAG: hypothetical protein JWR26_3843 [Pedosphaera sp.]|nr:hypothetical protein [Pedosphaera sp.]
MRARYGYVGIAMERVFRYMEGGGRMIRMLLALHSAGPIRF